MTAKKKFDEDDRRRVIAVIERHFDISLRAISSFRKYLRDEQGRRYIVLGGYEDWHGISRRIFALEEASPADTTLIIAKRTKAAIDIFSGPFRPLLDHKHDLPKTDTQYEFNLCSGINGLTVREVPNLVLRRLGETDYTVEEKQAEIRNREVAALLDRLSPTERAELIQRLKNTGET